MDQATYQQQLARFVADCRASRPEFTQFVPQPCLEDDTARTGFDTHYVYHVAWALRRLVAQRPIQHVDISSSLHFVSAASALVPTTFYDFRPAELRLDGLQCVAGDLTNDAHWATGGFDSVSCMHVVEHIGLGRYGDQLDANGDLRALANLRRMLAPGGRLLFVVPVGRPMVCFNAHRIYPARWIANWFADDFDLREFYLIPPHASQAPIAQADLAEADRMHYACGCFELVRR